MAAGSMSLDHVNSPKTRRRTPTGDAFRQLIKNRAAVFSIFFIVVIVFVAIFVDTTVFTWFTGAEPQPLIAPYDFRHVDFAHTNAPAFTTTEKGNFYMLGTDYLGRDNLSRTLYGSRISLAVAFVAATVSLSRRHSLWLDCWLRQCSTRQRHDAFCRFSLWVSPC